MTDSYGPMLGQPWNEGEWHDFAFTWAPSGVIGTPAAAATSGELAFASSGLNVSAGTGKSWIAGTGFKRTGTVPTHAAAANGHASWQRRDRLVLRRDLANHQVVTAIVQGTPAASPVAPTLTQNVTGTYELPLHSFLVPPNNGTTITGVVDERSWIDPTPVFPERTLGEAYLAAPIVGGTVATPSWTDVLSVTATSRGRECVAKWHASAFNGNSNLNRTMSYRVVCDGTVIGTPMTGISVPLASFPRIPRMAIASSTPGPGSHTWKLQANGDAGAAVVPEAALLTILER